MFKSETATYAFDTYDSCIISEIIVPIPDSATIYNIPRAGYGFIATPHQIKPADISNPFYGIEWYRPNHLTARMKDIPLVIEGLIEVGAMRAKIRESKKFNLTLKDFAYYGIPNIYDPNISDSHLFVPDDLSVFNPMFARCPERYWFNSIFLIFYMMFVVILLVNLLVAMFATTYSKISESSAKIWKRQR